MIAQFTDLNSEFTIVLHYGTDSIKNNMTAMSDNYYIVQHNGTRTETKHNLNTSQCYRTWDPRNVRFTTLQE